MEDHGVQGSDPQQENTTKSKEISVGKASIYTHLSSLLFSRSQANGSQEKAVPSHRATKVLKTVSYLFNSMCQGQSKERKVETES